MARRQNFQTISWFYDLWNRKLLNLDPPYQRRSVWNQRFKDYFIDTVLLNYPAPAIFVYEEISPDGRSMYHVVDGKQRLTTLFEFVMGEFPVGDGSEVANLRGAYFNTLDDAIKKSFWGYQFLFEYVPSDEGIINAIFDRLNRNVAKLTQQELRHAKLDGVFINTAETLTEWMLETLPPGFPRITSQGRKQMKDIEFVALLLLLLEEGPAGYSQDALDGAFTKRDEAWDERNDVEGRFRASITAIHGIVRASNNLALAGTRMRNQADFYSLVGAVDSLLRGNRLKAPVDAAVSLMEFTQQVDTEDARTAGSPVASITKPRGPHQMIKALEKRAFGFSSKC